MGYFRRVLCCLCSWYSFACHSAVLDLESSSTMLCETCWENLEKHFLKFQTLAGKTLQNQDKMLFELPQIIYRVSEESVSLPWVILPAANIYYLTRQI